jgi:hypothetical protein
VVKRQVFFQIADDMENVSGSLNLGYRPDLCRLGRRFLRMAKAQQKTGGGDPGVE